MPEAAMVSYAETQDEEPFDWNSYLEHYYDLPLEDHAAARERAADWVTCACGNQCSVISRDRKTGAPFDNELRSHGTRFYEALVDSDVDLARAMLKAIEKRSARLVKEHIRVFGPLK